MSLQGSWPSIIQKMGGGANGLQFSKPDGLWPVSARIAYLYF